MKTSTADDVQVIEAVPLTGGTFSAELVPQIAALLAKHNSPRRASMPSLSFRARDRLLAFASGWRQSRHLAEILQKPIVSRFVARGDRLGRPCRWKSPGSARRRTRRRVRGGIRDCRQFGDSSARTLLSKDEFLSVARGMVVSTSEANLAGIVRDAGLSVVSVEQPSAEMIAQLGWKKLRAGETVSPEQLEANYIRRTDAEIFAKPARS